MGVPNREAGAIKVTRPAPERSAARVDRMGGAAHADRASDVDKAAKGALVRDDGTFFEDGTDEVVVHQKMGLPDRFGHLFGNADREGEDGSRKLFAGIGEVPRLDRFKGERAVGFDRMGIGIAAVGIGAARHIERDRFGMRRLTASKRGWRRPGPRRESRSHRRRR